MTYSTGLVGLYVFYVVVVIVGRVVYQWWKKRRGKNVKLGNGDIPSKDSRHVLCSVRAGKCPQPPLVPVTVMA